MPHQTFRENLYTWERRTGWRTTGNRAIGASTTVHFRSMCQFSKPIIGPTSRVAGQACRTARVTRRGTRFAVNLLAHRVIVIRVATVTRSFSCHQFPRGNFLRERRTRGRSSPSFRRIVAAVYQSPDRSAASRATVPSFREFLPRPAASPTFRIAIDDRSPGAIAGDTIVEWPLVNRWWTAAGEQFHECISGSKIAASEKEALRGTKGRRNCEVDVKLNELMNNYWNGSKLKLYEWVECEVNRQV